MVEIKNIEISPVEIGTKPEQHPETEAGAAKKAKPAETAPSTTPAVNHLTTSSEVPAVADGVMILQQVENILAENMDNVFLSMDSAEQVRFKAQGEATAQAINGLFQKGKATAISIINLITHWLRFIPRVNRHFLEQEAKIKADAILKIYNRD